MMFLQSVRFSMFFSLAPTFPVSSIITSKNLLFGLSLFLFPGNFISITLILPYFWSLFMACPYHLSLFSLIFIPNRSTLAVPLMHPKFIEQPHVDTVTSNRWLLSNLKGKREGLLVAAQDQAINTRNYHKVICGQQLESKCRMCLLHEETMTYILSGCEVLDKAEYISLNNNAATYLHWSICKNQNIEITDKWYKHKPATMIHNRQNNITIMIDMPVNTDSTTTVNRPNIIIKYITSKLIDITVPSTRNIVLKENEKKPSTKTYRTKNAENVVYDNRSDPCGCWCT